jgi:glycosyltransferase involved in cell wall biosynthesis
MTTTSPLTYTLISPVRNEADNLERIAGCLERQTLLPHAWIIVDNGSSDATPELARGLAARHAWVRVIEDEPDLSAPRGAPIVRAFHAGVRVMNETTDIVVKLDVDLSFAADYFERILGHFATDAQLGIASGVAYEPGPKGWWLDRGARQHVRGNARVYRWACLRELLPLEERMGWDGLDEVKAQVLGWDTRFLSDIRYLHHRPLGQREGARVSKWRGQGRMHHYMGYRPSYLLLRALYRMGRDPLAAAIVWGYAESAVRREPQCPDAAVVARLRSQQAARALPTRLREMLGAQA